MKIWPNITFLIVTMLLLSSLQILIFAQTESPSPTVDTSVPASTTTFKIISQNDAEYLLSSCNVKLIESAYDAYLNAYAQKVSTGPTSTTNMENYSKQLQNEINIILLSCLQKELSMRDCTKGGCAYNTMELVIIKQDIFVEYFGYQFEENGKNLWTEDGLKKAKEMYQNKLEQCYYELLRNCNCDIDGIISLWGTLNLDDYTSYRLDDNRVERLNKDIQDYLLFCYSLKLDKCGCDIDCLEKLLGQVMSDTSGLRNSDQDDLTDKILSKYQQCIEKKVAESTNIDELVGFALDNKTLEFKKTTIYDNYSLIINIIARINALYKLDINLSDTYFLKCCDRSIYLKNLYLLIKQYEKENKLPQLKDHQIVKDPYTYCRIIMLDQETKGCNVDSFCKSLACQGLYGGYGKDAYESTINDPKDAPYLSYYKKRLIECSGMDIKLEDLMDYCSLRNTNRNWTDFKNKYSLISTINITTEVNTNASNNKNEELLFPVYSPSSKPEGGSTSNRDGMDISIDNKMDKANPELTEAFVNLEKLILEKEKDQNKSKTKKFEIIVSGKGEDSNISTSKTYKIGSLNLPDVEKISKETNTSMIIPISINNNNVEKIVVLGTDGKNSILVDGNTTAKINVDVSIDKDGLHVDTNNSNKLMIKTMPSDISSKLPNKLRIKAGPNPTSTNSSNTKKWCFRVAVTDEPRVISDVGGGPVNFIVDSNATCFYINDSDYSSNYMNIIEYKDGIAYDFNLEEEAKILGLIPVKYIRKVTVDAATGNVFEIQRPFWSFLVKETEIPTFF